MRRFLPPVDSRAYHLLLGCVAILLLGPLGGIAAAYMNFSLGFFMQGQVLAGILGSIVTYGYGPDGKHGANYMQTMAASVANMCGAAVVMQAMVWLGMPLPSNGTLMLFFGSVGMFGVGLGMLMTPILVDRLQLEYPSGHAVANILRALTDKTLLRRSVARLGGGTALGAGLGAVVERVPLFAASYLSPSTIGAAMIVGSRIAVPALTMGLIGWWLTPGLRAAGWLGPHDSFRKIGFLVALAMILGAAAVDLAVIARDAIARLRDVRGAAPPTGRPLRLKRLLLWTLVWGAAVLAVSVKLLGQPPGFVLLGLVLSVLFVLVNGISQGITDSNPISSAFVIAVLVMSGLGLRDPRVGLMAATILLVSCNTGVDMQQDRSTGARLGTDRDMQFRYQVVGIVMGAALTVGLAKVFMASYPVLTIDLFSHPEAKTGGWQSAMTYKLVGALRDLGHLPRFKVKALALGFVIGLVTEIARKALARWERYRRLTQQKGAGFAVGWVVDALLLPSPYASSFGGFVELGVTIWWAIGGAFSSLLQTLGARRRPDGEALPSDMGAVSLIGGGLIAGEALYALAVGLIGLLALV